MCLDSRTFGCVYILVCVACLCLEVRALWLSCVFVLLAFALNPVVDTCTCPHTTVSLLGWVGVSICLRPPLWDTIETTESVRDFVCVIVSIYLPTHTHTHTLVHTRIVQHTSTTLWWALCVAELRRRETNTECTSWPWAASPPTVGWELVC